MEILLAYIGLFICDDWWWLYNAGLSMALLSLHSLTDCVCNSLLTVFLFKCLLYNLLIVRAAKTLILSYINNIITAWSDLTL